MNPTILPNIRTTIGLWLRKIVEVIMLWIQWNKEAIMRGLLWSCNWKVVKSTHFLLELSFPILSLSKPLCNVKT